MKFITEFNDINYFLRNVSRDEMQISTFRASLFRFTWKHGAHDSLKKLNDLTKAERSRSCSITWYQFGHSQWVQFGHNSLIIVDKTSQGSNTKDGKYGGICSWTMVSSIFDEVSFFLKSPVGCRAAKNLETDTDPMKTDTHLINIPTETAPCFEIFCIPKITFTLHARQIFRPSDSLKNQRKDILISSVFKTLLTQ